MRLVVLCAAALVVAVPQMAVAQESTRPVIDHAPAEVPYRGSAVVRGHVQGSSGTEKVTLQKERGGEWRDLETNPVDDEGKVSFRLDGLTRSADYRLLMRDAGGGSVPSEGRARIRVASRVTLEVEKRHVMSGRRVHLSGHVLAPARGREVVLRQKVDGRWRFLAKRPVTDGRFAHDFRVRSKGFRPLRAIFRGDDRNSAGRASDFVKVYSRHYATWYGPGLYGNRTACGRRLRHGTLGVAHRTLPCGTDVSILYRGRTITVPVIDRGPYAHGADYDLTEETAERLHFRSSDTIGVTR